MGDTVAVDDYGIWISPLFPSHGYLVVGTVSACVSLALFWVGYGVSVVGGFPYLTKLGGYLGAFTVFCMLSVLGVADGVYVDVWRDVRHAFDVDDETYWSVVCPRLEQVHDVRRILVYAAAIGIPYFYIVAVGYIRSAPLNEAAVELFYGGQLSYPRGIPTVVLLYLFGSVNALLLGTIVSGFVNHLTLVREVSALPFRNVYTAGADLEPVAGFTIASATVWFAGVSLIVLWILNGISETIGTAIMGMLVFAGLVFFLAPQLLLHDALADAKREELVKLRSEYMEMHELVRAGSSDPVGPRLEITDRRLEHAKSIDTWVYNLTSLSKLAAAAVIPWLTLLQQLFL